jgi:hypothetical protein
MNKQIEEITNELVFTSNYGTYNAVAEHLYNKGYRKTSDVAREIFDGVMQAIEEGTKNATSTLKQSITTHEKLLVSTGEMYSGFVGKAICQFFKKYESEGADDEKTTDE